VSKRSGFGSSEFFYLDADGNRCDAFLHEEILANGDAEAAKSVTRTWLVAKGFAADSIESLLGGKCANDSKPQEDDEKRSRPANRNLSETVYLVSCVSQKQKGPCQALELYSSQWFRKARAYVEAANGPWFILSAKYRLLSPETMVSDYNVSLNTMSQRERQAWAHDVIAQMDRSLPAAEKVVVLAGIRYREFLMDYLRQRFRNVEVPMEGLSIGRQLQWFKQSVPHGNL
jgi:hypothetical protein